MSGLELEEGSSGLQSSGLTMPPPSNSMKQMKLQFSMSQATDDLSTDNSTYSNTGQTCDSTFNLRIVTTLSLMKLNMILHVVHAWVV